MPDIIICASENKLARLLVAINRGFHRTFSAGAVVIRTVFLIKRYIPIAIRAQAVFETPDNIVTDMKYTSVQKEQAVMIVDCKGDLAEQQHIAGILGRRMDDRYKITSETETIIRITIL